MVDRSELFRDNRSDLLLPSEQPLLSFMFRRLVLRLQLGKRLHHTQDEVLVLALHDTVLLLRLHRPGQQRS